VKLPHVKPFVPLEPDVPEVPLDPEVPSAPLVPEEPSVAEVPEDPEVPEVPLEPELPFVPLVPDVPAVPLVPTQRPLLDIVKNGEDGSTTEPLSAQNVTDSPSFTVAFTATPEQSMYEKG